MTKDSAETAITLSALVVGGVYVIRKLVEPEVTGAVGKGEQLHAVEDYRAIFGAGPPLEWGEWLRAAGSLFIVLAIVGAASPDIGGAGAILIGTGALIGNGVALQKDLSNSAGQREQQSARVKQANKLAGGSNLQKGLSDSEGARIESITNTVAGRAAGG